jgi:hypothetical protein
VGYLVASEFSIELKRSIVELLITSVLLALELEARGRNRNRRRHGTCTCKHEPIEYFQGCQPKTRNQEDDRFERVHF